ncbi:hypothetical protein [Endozoicomonas sp. ALB122]|uniref:hypothetical protein n=2 Tax=Endozoicomonas TaxID=305899 RepID=UPI003BB4E978
MVIMLGSIDTLANLIEENATREDKRPVELLYRFVSASHPSYEIPGCEVQAICLLIEYQESSFSSS